MQSPWTVDLIWWISVVEMPALVGLFWLGWRTRRDTESSLDEARQKLEAGLAHSCEQLSAFKLEVAKSYASIAYLKEVERRLTDHLVRIEDKLDRTNTNAKGAGE
jgi:hypothetical protein